MTIFASLLIAAGAVSGSEPIVLKPALPTASAAVVVTVSTAARPFSLPNRSEAAVSRLRELVESAPLEIGSEFDGAAARAVAGVKVAPAEKPSAAPVSCGVLMEKSRLLEDAAAKCDAEIAAGARRCVVEVSFPKPALPPGLSADAARGFAASFRAVASTGNEELCFNFGGGA